jgi:hypothetical protein
MVTMIYKRQEYLQEAEEGSRFPVKRIDVLEPVEGGARKFVGQLALGLQTPVGVQHIPVSFEIEAETIQEAFQNFEEQAQPHVERTRKSVEQELSKMRQEASSRIVRPGQMGLGGTGEGGQGIVDLDQFKK